MQSLSNVSPHQIRFLRLTVTAVAARKGPQSKDGLLTEGHSNTLQAKELAEQLQVMSHQTSHGNYAVG
jgi:hypothetical protein